jgi:tripartite ATP-independent transporter DctP family solute receptor
MKKMRLILCAVLCVAGLMAGCAKKEAVGNVPDQGRAAEVKTVTWKLAFNQSIEHPQARALIWFSEQFERETGGAYKIEINPNELLGNQKESLESLQMGIIQMAMVANSIIEPLNADFAIIALPGLYNSVEHQRTTFESGVLDDLFRSTAQNDFYCLAGFHGGVRNVYGKKAVRSPADIKGMKIRVMQSQLMLDTINAMGAVAVAMSQGEVYTAIQTGVLDGAENSEVTYWDLKQYEVAPVYSYTKHFMIPDILVIHKGTYDGLSAEHKAIFDRLVKETITLEFNNFAEQVQLAKQNAIDEGAQFIDDFDSNVFAASMQGVVEKNLSTPERKRLYDAIKALQ